MTCLRNLKLSQLLAMKQGSKLVIEFDQGMIVVYTGDKRNGRWKTFNPGAPAEAMEAFINEGSDRGNR